MKNILKNRSGFAMIDAIIILLVTVTVIMGTISVFDIIIKKQNVEYMAKRIVRDIEREGMYSSSQAQILQKLNDELKMNAAMSISNVKYFNSGARSIQLRDPFTITIDYTYKFKVLTPIGTGKPVTIDIPLKANITGVSEVYWKD